MIEYAREEVIGTDVVDRLRESLEADEKELHQSGFTDGAQWAQESAEAAELKRLERFRERMLHEPYHNWDWYFENDESNSAYSTAEGLAFEILGVDPDRHEAECFWGQAVGDYRNNDNLDEGSYLKGFAEGALDVWSKVESRL